MITPLKAFAAVAALAITSLLAGCGTTAILDRTARDPGVDESVVVLKVSPATYRLLFFPGTQSNGRFSQSFIHGAEINGQATEGYVVAKVKAGQWLGLTTVVETKDGSLIGGTQFNACGGARALVFEVPRGRVGYLTDIDYARAGHRVSIRYRNDLPAAASHVRARFPEIKAAVEQLEFQFLPTDKGCGGGTIFVPVYTGR